LFGQSIVEIIVDCSVKVKFQLFEKEGLLIQKFAGPFSMEIYQRYNQYLMTNPLLRCVSRVLNDFRDIVIDSGIEDFDGHVQRVAEFRRNVTKNQIKRNDVTVVFWVDKPFPTVIVQLFKEFLADQHSEYCSSHKSLIEVLKLPSHLQNLDDIINNLSNTFGE
jgi:hypothetical protein